MKCSCIDVATICYYIISMFYNCFFFFFQAEDGIRDLVRSRGLGDVYKRQTYFSIEHRNVGTDSVRSQCGQHK